MGGGPQSVPFLSPLPQEFAGTSLGEREDATGVKS